MFHTNPALDEFKQKYIDLVDSIFPIARCKNQRPIEHIQINCMAKLSNNDLLLLPLSLLNF